jgi:hypothetical protein
MRVSAIRSPAAAIMEWDMLSDIRRLITRELEGFQREIALFPDDESIWRTAPGVTNSAGNLAVHVCGGLRYFVGTALGGDGYVRNRDEEFGRRSGSREAVNAELANTIDVVNTVLSGAADSWIGKPFPVAVNGLHLRTELFLLHLVAHAAFHLGQAGYLRRLLMHDARSAGPIPMGTLVEDPTAEGGQA